MALSNFLRRILGSASFPRFKRQVLPSPPLVDEPQTPVPTPARPTTP